ncbi:MAG: SurA N-terminal domain-containing protein [Deltaproteobacteria bacterium]|nr:SurA N-terminal domain-containing protein [Deltaproteobacteria bacterium]
MGKNSFFIKYRSDTVSIVIDQKTFKHLAFFAGCTFLFICCSFSDSQKAWGAKVVDRIVATVNDEIVLLYDLNQTIKPYVDRIKASNYSYEKERQMLFKLRENALNMLIEQKLADQEIKRYKISVSGQEINNAIEGIKKTTFITDEELREELKRQGLTLEEYRKQIKEEILREKLISREVKSKIVITSEDIKAYYKNHKDLYSEKKRYHLRNIIMKVAANADETEKLIIFKKIEAVLSELKKGEAFDKLARVYSDSPLASEGGDLGLFEIKDLSPQLQEAVKELKEGEYTPVLDTDQGYQILYVQEIKKYPGKTLEESTSAISQKLYKDTVNIKYASWLKDLKSRSHIKIIR